MIDPEMQEIAAEFVIEARETLDALDGKFVQLEKAPTPALIDEIFRAMHTIKGAAGFLSLARTVEVAHAGEDVMGRLRSGGLELSSEIIDTILETVDVLKALIEDVAAGADSGVETAGVVARLRAILSGGAAPKAAQPAPKAAQPAPKAAEKAPAPKAAKAAKPAKPAKSAKGGKKKTQEAAPAPAGGKLDERDCFTEAEFDALLAEAQAAESAPSPAPAAAKVDDRDCFTEAEFDALLAQVQGEKRAAAAPVDQDAAPAAPAKAPQAAKPIDMGDPTIRIDIRRLDHVMNLVGELVLDRNRILKTAARLEEQRPDDAAVRDLAGCAAHLDLVASDLQVAVMKTRMIPIKKVFSRFPRMMRDLARDLGKEIDLEIVGEETELDKSLVEEIGDPLLHLLRNSADHGVEKPDVREKAGKPRAGTIRVAAVHEGDNIVIEIQDDGKGMDHEVIRRKAVQKGIIDEAAAERMAKRDVLNLIFAPGFSTAEKVTDVSGRGVGMDVVKHNISKLNGLIEIDTDVGKGTRILLKLPLTIAIIRSLMVDLAGATYAVPLAMIVEIVRLTRTEIRTVDGEPVIHLRDSVIPLVDLKSALGISRGREESRWVYVVIVGRAEGRYGLIVDRLHGLEEVVIKSMGEVLPQGNHVSGATVNGDGDVILILNIAGILQDAGSAYLAAA